MGSNGGGSPKDGGMAEKIAMNNNYGNGQLWVKVGVGGRSGWRRQPPPPPPNQIITGNSSTPYDAYFFLAINERGTSSGGGGSGDGSSGARGVHAAVCSSGGVGAAASSVRWWSRRWRRTGAQLQWMAGCQRACGIKLRMWRACNSVQRSGVCATGCSGRERVGAASSTIAMEDSDGSQWRWRRKEQRLTATSC
jgi:hypothetical protein